MIVVTGGAGFIGSCLIWQLNEMGLKKIVVVDDLGHGDKWKNLVKRDVYDIIRINHSMDWLKAHAKEIEFIFHMGACSTTTEADADYLVENNVHYSMDIFTFSAQENIPLIYASSAATYGSGELGYRDDVETTTKLRPINKYGYSKQLFDTWVLQQKKKPPMWLGFKFFNVYGPQEYHKGGQASVVFHAYPQVKDKGVLKLFKSYLDGYADGEQKRDFIYVKDVVAIMANFYKNQSKDVSGIYNLGTGQARTFIDLGKAVFKALEVENSVFDWIEMPDNLRKQYQYFTEADLGRLRKQGQVSFKFTSLEDGVRDYVQNYLTHEDAYL